MLKVLGFDKKKQETKPKPVIVADLDSILSRTVSFVLHGRTLTLVPMSVENWLIAVSNESKLRALQSQTVVTPDELIKAYYDFISQLCPDITEDDIRNCTQQQVASLWQLALDTLNGYAEKKTLLTWAFMGMSQDELRKIQLVVNKLLLMSPDSYQKFVEKLDGQSNMS